jgi:hypothetical protein
MTQAGLLAQLPQLRGGQTEQSRGSIFVNLFSSRQDCHRSHA